MSSERKVTTAYAEYVYSNLPKHCRVGQGSYNYNELAAMVGLKPTQHFKRRVRDLVQMNVLKIIPTFTPKGGIENRFSYEVTDMGEYPF